MWKIVKKTRYVWDKVGERAGGFNQVTEYCVRLQTGELDRMPRHYSSTPPPTTSDKNEKYGSEGDGGKGKMFMGIGAALAGAAVAAWYMDLMPGKKDCPMFEKFKKADKNPKSSEEIPAEAEYVLIGAGSASFAAANAIRGANPNAKILMIGNESYVPYARPPLSKNMWFGPDSGDLSYKNFDGSQKSVVFAPEAFYASCDALQKEAKGLGIARGWNVKRVDPSAKKVVLEDGKEIKYGKLLIATGVHHKRLPILNKPYFWDKVTTFRDVDDYHYLRKKIGEGVKNIVVIGGGFLGSELASVLAANPTLTVTQVFPGDGIYGRILPDYLSAWMTNKLAERRVNVMNKTEVAKAEYAGNQIKLHLKNGSEVVADHIVVAIGAEPNVDLAKKADLPIDPQNKGFLANSTLSILPDIYVAGDCASYPDAQMGRVRLEHIEHAFASGKVAGENMTGADKQFSNISSFGSGIGPDVRFEAVGQIDSKLPTVGFFSKPGGTFKVVAGGKNASILKAEDNYAKGVVFYLRDDKIVGILLWNLSDKTDQAKKIVADAKKFDDSAVKNFL